MNCVYEKNKCHALKCKAKNTKQNHSIIVIEVLVRYLLEYTSGNKHEQVYDKMLLICAKVKKRFDVGIEMHTFAHRSIYII